QPAAPAAPVPGQPAAPAAPVPGQPAAPVHGPQMAGKPELIRIWQSTHNQIGTMENRLKSLNHSMGQIELAIEQSSMLAPPTTPLHQGSTPGSDSERNRAELQNVMQAINVDKARRHDQGQT
nr:hypothetical protein [Endozoicomonas sp.]